MIWCKSASSSKSLKIKHYQEQVCIKCPQFRREGSATVLSFTDATCMQQMYALLVRGPVGRKEWHATRRGGRISGNTQTGSLDVNIVGKDRARQGTGPTGEIYRCTTRAGETKPRICQALYQCIMSASHGSRHVLHTEAGKGTSEEELVHLVDSPEHNKV